MEKRFENTEKGIVRKYLQHFNRKRAESQIKTGIYKFKGGQEKEQRDDGKSSQLEARVRSLVATIRNYPEAEKQRIAAEGTKERANRATRAQAGLVEREKVRRRVIILAEVNDVQTQRSAGPTVPKGLQAC